ncbi:MAG: ribbon-helix-helix protein, CopG family [Anaerolineae bacterium]
MPQLTIDLTWNEKDALETLAAREEISVEELVRRAIDSYLAADTARQQMTEGKLVAAERDHLLGSSEALDLDL